MSRTNTGHLLNMATKVLTQKAVERAHGGWIPEKHRKKLQTGGDSGQDPETKQEQPYDLGQQIQKGTEMVSRIPESVNRLYVEPITTGIHELMRPVFEGGGPESYQNPEMVGHAIDVVGGLGAGSLLTGPAAAEAGVLRSGMGPVAKEAAKTGIRAYHGSPYEFEKFDLSKIGTGEGAQAYGHGLYFAEHEPVAKGYRDNLTQMPGGRASGKKGYKIDGQIIGENDLTPSQQAAINEIQMYNNDAEKAFNINKKHGEIFGRPNEELLNEINNLKGKKIEEYKGHMYEVNINAQPEHFLDWDKPLAEQHPHVQDRFIQAMAGNDPLSKELVQGLTPEDYGVIGLFPKSKGSQAYKTLADQIGGEEKASKLLNDLGIKGVKYLDAGSRNKGDGTRNYVVFDPENIEIMRRYAIGGDVEPLENDGKMRVLNRKHGGRVYPLAPKEDWESHDGDDDGEIIYMTPDEFLGKAQKMKGSDSDKKSVKSWEKKIENGEKMGPAALYTDGSQNGRHRVTAAKNMGIKKVPVLTYEERGEKPAQGYMKSAHKIARTASKK